MKTRAVTEGAMMAAITVIIGLLYNFIPFFSMLSYFLLPLPTTILFKRHGVVVASVSAAAACIILFLFTGPLNAVILGVDILIPGLLIGYSYRKNESGDHRVIYGYFAFLGTLLIEMFVLERIMGVNVFEDFINDINTSVKMIDEFYTANSSFNAEELKQFTENIAAQAETLKMLFPTIIVVSPILLSWITILIDDFVFKRSGESYQPVKPITEWKLSNPAKGILALITFISVIAQQLITDNAYQLYPFTAVTIVNMIYLVMGLSFIFWLYERRFHKKMYWLRVLTLVLMAILPGLGFIVTVVGIFDIYIDLRRFFNK